MDRFDKNARALFVMAQQLAEQRKDAHIGVEHLLLAMLKLDKDPAGRFLREHGVEPEHIDAASAGLPKRTSLNDPLGMSASAKRALANAAEEAKQLNSLFVKSEHVLLGIVNLKANPVVDQVCAAIEMTPEAIDRQLRRSLLPPVYQPPPAPVSRSEQSPAAMPGIGLYDQMVNGLTGLLERLKTWLRQRRQPPDEVGEPVKRD